MAEYRRFRIRFIKGELSHIDYHLEFARLYASRDAILDELKTCYRAQQLVRLATALGARGTKRPTKDANAESVYRGMLRTFVLDDTFSPPVNEHFEEAVRRKVQATTCEEQADYYRRKFWQG
jgi:hypothetical protein